MEIEAKIKVQDEAGVRAKLRGLGACFAGRYREDNHVFDHPALQLHGRGQALRVRDVHTLEGQPQVATLTFKGTVDDSARFKVRPEIEVAVRDPARMIEILEALGFTRLITFEKIRESWAYAGCRVELDELPHLGHFVEVEGPDENAIRKVLVELGCREEEHIPGSYVGLLISHCQAAGLPVHDIRFLT